MQENLTRVCIAVYSSDELSQSSRTETPGSLSGAGGWVWASELRTKQAFTVVNMEGRRVQHFGRTIAAYHCRAIKWFRGVTTTPPPPPPPPEFHSSGVLDRNDSQELTHTRTFAGFTALADQSKVNYICRRSYFGFEVRSCLSRRTKPHASARLLPTTCRVSEAWFQVAVAGIQNTPHFRVMMVVPLPSLGPLSNTLSSLLLPISPFVTCLILQRGPMCTTLYSRYLIAAPLVLQRMHKTTKEFILGPLKFTQEARIVRIARPARLGGGGVLAGLPSQSCRKSPRCTHSAIYGHHVSI